MLVVYVNITGTIKLACDLCLNEFDQNTDITEQLVVKFQDADLDDITDEIIVLGKNDHEFSIADFLYEHITLSVPLYIRCEAQEGQRCDEEMVRVLRDLSPKPTEEKLDDPRWAALKNITRNN